MSAADYEALKRYLERWCPACHGIWRNSDYRWDSECQRCNGTERLNDTPAPTRRTHRFNHNDDRAALLSQAEEVARLLGMGHECPTCDGDGWTWRDDEDFEPGRETCFDCNGTGRATVVSGPPAIDRLAIADIGPVKRPRCGGDDCVYLRRYDDCPDCQRAYALPKVPCETCGGTGECFRLGRSRPPDSCASCNGTGRVDKHVYQSPNESVVAVESSSETEYPCGKYPIPGGKAWRVIATNEVRNHETSSWGKWYESEIRVRRVQRALDIGLHLSDGAKLDVLCRARLVAAPHAQRWRDAYQAIGRVIAADLRSPSEQYVVSGG